MQEQSDQLVEEMCALLEKTEAGPVLLWHEYYHKHLDCTGPFPPPHPNAAYSYSLERRLLDELCVDWESVPLPVTKIHLVPFPIDSMAWLLASSVR